MRFRRDRQRRVLADPPDLTIVLGAGALSLVVGSPAVMDTQIDHLRRLDGDGVATVRVLPWTAGAYPTKGSFTLLDFPDDGYPTVVYVESSLAARYVEKAAQVAEYQQAFEDLMGRTISLEEWT